MKTKILLTIFLIGFFNIFIAEADIYKAEGTNRFKVSTCVRVGDIWAERWNSSDYKVATTLADGNFIVTLYPRNEEAWNYFCKITIKDFTIPNRKTIYKNQNSALWFSYDDCDIEFFYNIEYPSIEECFANYGGFVVNSKNQSAKKRTVKGRVTLNPYFFTAGKRNHNNTGKENMVVNFFFDEVGFAIDFYDYLLFKIK